jgi:uncharacterized membrane protein YtjA (UPF0391 family)
MPPREIVTRAYCADNEPLEDDFTSVECFAGATSIRAEELARFKRSKQRRMLDFAYFFFALAVIAALLGFLGLMGMAALVAKGFCLIFLALFVIATIRHHPHR